MYELREMLSSLLVAAAIAAVGWWGWGILDWVWLKPRRMEKHLRNQGYRGNPYKVLFGDLKEFSALAKQANSTPSLSQTTSFLVLHLFFTQPSPLMLMIPAFHVSCIEMISAWEKAMEESKLEVDVWPYIQTLSADVISRTAFGSSYEEGRKIFELLKVQTGLVLQALSTLYIPGLRFLPTRKNLRMKNIANELNNLLNDLIYRRIEALKAREATNEDLLSILLESNFKNVDEHHKGKYGKMVGMTIKEIILECKLFYFAGQETTAALLIWTMVLLAQHQEWQQKVRDEVIQVFGLDNKPNFDELSRLKIVTMILNEVLRLYPPGVEISRCIKEDMKLGESLNLQAGKVVTLPIILLHHDKKIWGDDAKEFKPERFAEGILKATKGQHSYFPFSSGPRICIGQNFALLEAKMALAMILQRFLLEISPSYTHAPQNNLIIHKL